MYKLLQNWYYKTGLFVVIYSSKELKCMSEKIILDSLTGGLVRASDLFLSTGATNNSTPPCCGWCAGVDCPTQSPDPGIPPSIIFTVTDLNGQPVSYAVVESSTKGIRIIPTDTTPTQFSLRVTATTAAGESHSRTVDVVLSSLSFTRLPVSSRFPAVAVGDWNGDGRKDLAGSIQNADGSFTSPDPNSIGLGKLFANGRLQRDQRLVDLDNDGDLELIANTYAASVTGPNINYMFANDGTGNFTEVTSFTNLNIQGYGETIVTADFNNDGLNDFYLPAYFRNGDYGSRLFLNQGNLAFSEQTNNYPITNSTGSLTLKGFGTQWDGIMPEGAEVLDFNKDGRIDLYVGSHLFLNQGNSFTDVGQSMGLPIVFDEGSKWFDWNNDGHLDLILLAPNGGPQLYQYNSTTAGFDLKDVFPGGRRFENAYGVSVGDFNGDSWEDLYISGGTTKTPRIYLNEQGQNFAEYRSQVTEDIRGYAGAVIEDINGDGQLDLITGATGGILANISLSETYAIEIDLRGPNGERNQYGRIVQLKPTDTNDPRILTRIVDGGSGYMAQKDYSVMFTDSQAKNYTAKCYLIDYPTATPVLVEFTAESDHKYIVRSAQGIQLIEIRDKTTNTSISYTRTYTQTSGNDTLELIAPGVVKVSGEGGEDLITLKNNLNNGWAGSIVEGGTGDDTLVFNGTNAYTNRQVKLIGGDGNDTIRAATTTGQYVGALRVEGGTGNDIIEIGHVEGSRSNDSGIDGGNGDDSILVLPTLGDVGIFGNSRFNIFGGAGNDKIELRGRQFNLLGVLGSVVDGGTGFDTFVWNGRFDLNRNTNQTGVDAANPAYAQEVGVRNVELLDIAASGATGLNLTLNTTDVATITTGSNFDQTTLTGLNLTGTGKTLLVKLGDLSNQSAISSEWTILSNTTFNGITYTAYQNTDKLLLFNGGQVKKSDWMGTANNDTYISQDGTSSTDISKFLAQGLAGDDSITIISSTINSRAGSRIEGGSDNDTLTFNGSNAYTTQQVKLLGGDGNDIIRAGTANGQYVGALRIEGGTGNDTIEIGHVEGSQSNDSGIDAGDGDDSILVLTTFADVGIFGNSKFDIQAGAGNDKIELRGRQFNLLGANSNVVDGGTGFDTFVWNGRFDLNQNTNQTGVDATNPVYAQEIGVRNVELLDVAASGATGLNLTLNPVDVNTITAGSDFDRATLTGLNLTGIGKTLFVKLGDVSNRLNLDGNWLNLPTTTVNATNYTTYQTGDTLLLLTGGQLVKRSTWIGTASNDTYISQDGATSTDTSNFLAQGLAGDDNITIISSTINSRAGSRIEGGSDNDTLTFNGSNAYTTQQVKLLGGDGNDIIRAGTANGQYVGALRIESGTGNDTIEIGHVEGSQSNDSGIDAGDGDDSILVLSTLADIGISGDGVFNIQAGAGNDKIELRGKQFNLLGANGNVIDGGTGFDTFVWNGRFDLNQNTNQTGVDAANPAYAQEVGVQNVELLDIAASGATGLNLTLNTTDVVTITTGSNFDQTTLTGLNLTGTGKTLLVKLGDLSNQSVISSEWTTLSNTTFNGITYTAYQNIDKLLLFNGGQVKKSDWMGTTNNDTYISQDGTSSTDISKFLAIGLAGDDSITIISSTINSRAGSIIEGDSDNDTLTFNGSNAYTTQQVKLLGGDGNDIIRAGTANGQYVGALRIEGGIGNDTIEIGSVQGSQSNDSGIDGGDGDDSILVLSTLADVGIFGDGVFNIQAGSGNDKIELRGKQFNLLGANGNIVDGGTGFDTFVWSGRFDLNQNTNQTGVDATNPAYAQEIGVRNVELLDVAASGATGLSLTLNAADVTAITAGSDFNRSTLTNLNLTGTGKTLFIKLGSVNNQLNLDGNWLSLGNTSFGGTTYTAYQNNDTLSLVSGGPIITRTAWLGTINSDTYISQDGATSTNASKFLAQGLAGDDNITIISNTLNSRAGSIIEGGSDNDTLTFNGSNAYTTQQVKLLGGDGNDIIRAGTANGQYVGALRIEGGTGNDTIEIGHVEGSQSNDSGIDAGDGDDSILVLATFSDVGIFGNSKFDIQAGAGNDKIELKGRQFNLLGANGNIVDGGTGFDTFAWNGRFDLNRNTNQTGVDAANPVYAQEIGVRNIELLDVAASGATGLTLALNAADVTAITAGSDFNRATLTGLNLAGTGETLFVKLGSVSNQLNIGNSSTNLGTTSFGGTTYTAYQNGATLLLAAGGRVITQTAWIGTANNDTYTSLDGATSTDARKFLAQGLAGDDNITIISNTLNSRAGSIIEGGSDNDTLTFNGSNAYTTQQVKLLGGDGNDIIRAGTANGQYVGALRIEGGTGNDTIEIGHVEGSQSNDSGIDAGDGDDSILVLPTLGDISVFGNTKFNIQGGAGNDKIELRGRQFNLLGANGPVVDGGAGFDTFVWNGRFDLNQNTNQTGVDATNPPYAQEIGVRNIELLDIGASGTTGRSILLKPEDVTAITAGSDFDRSTLSGLGLSGIGKTLFVKRGAISNNNQLNIDSTWTNLGNTTFGDTNYTAYSSGDALLLSGS